MSSSSSRTSTRKYQKPSVKPALATIQEKSNENNSSNDSDIIVLKRENKIKKVEKVNESSNKSNKKKKNTLKQILQNIKSFFRPSATKKNRKI